MLKIDYRESDRCAVFGWDSLDDTSPWLDTLRRLAFDHTEEAQQEGGYHISLPWWLFLSLRTQINQLLHGFNLILGHSVNISPKAQELLKQANKHNQSYTLAERSSAVEEADLLARLQAIGFVRDLNKNQKRNICRIAALPSAATFSVPGSGKTTEALATYFFRSEPTERLLVIAPKNAFGAWDEQLEICVPNIKDNFVRLRGGSERIARLLQDDPRFMLITYQQLPRVKELIATHISKFPTHVYLDESHRIKSGIGRQTPQAVLSVSHLPVGKLIMSGTPMPQAIEDMVPQFSFLYPEIPVNDENVIDLIRPVYMRTNKAELGLPPLERSLKILPMAPVQGELYRLLKFEVARDAASALSIRSKQAFRVLGRSVARLLQFVSNPALLSRELGFAHEGMLSAVLAEGDGPKIDYVLRRARQLARMGHKVLIWSSFVQNVEYISERLVDLGAVYIHGGVDAGDEDDDETREGKIKLFHDNPNVKILVANPAAASEGISLHKVCHHAIYLDRTFNAAHYLQSEDRIHRLGLAPHEITHIEIVECAKTIDETVRQRLELKVRRMAQALNDSSLTIDPIPLDPPSIEDVEDYTVGLANEDIQALVRDLSSNGVA